ncbi:MAG TPA: hypothetical protein VEX86_22525 [Longimicrobium sp.]|nr:hypothetical protein [Longimicrobium sp.]
MRLRLLAVAALLLASACTSWNPQTAPAPEVVARSQGREPVRIVRTDASVLVLRSPRVVGDSIEGEAGSPPRLTRVALADVRRVETRGANAMKTGGLVFAVLTVLTVATLVLTFSFVELD